MTLGQWIPEYLIAYKLNTIRPDSYYTLWLVAGKLRNLIGSGAFRHFAEVRFSRFWPNASKSCKNSIFPGFVSR